MTRKPLASMSGFGAGHGAAGRVRVAVEIRTVNQRGLDVAVNLPDALQPMEPEVRAAIVAALARGRVDVRVQVERPAGRGGPGLRPLVDAPVAARHARELAALARRLGLERPRIESILALPGVLVREDPAPDPRALARGLAAGLTAALGRLVIMRRREGVALARDLLGRAASLEGGVREVERRWPEARRALEERQAGRLKELFERAGEGARASTAREFVAAADRGDVSEELTRLASHLAQFRETVAGGSPAGRKLEFLAQEFHREVNTIGSKSQDAALTRVVVAMKEDVERIREQLANVE